LKNVSRCSGIQVQGQFHRTVELDSRQAARKGDPAGLRESQREDLALSVARKRLRRGTACNRRNTLSILRIARMLHFVRNLSLTQ
jgi:transposase